MQIHEFWQRIEPAGRFERTPKGGFVDGFPAALPDGRQLLLPIRALDDGRHGLASLIVNQASFAVVDALAGMLADACRAFEPEMVVGLPTLGLTLADHLARAHGHERFVPLGTSRKFWYDEELSEPLSSITSPGAGKRLYVDPRMRPLLEGRRVLLVDDVLSTGSSITAACRLLGRLGIRPCGIGAAMLQTRRWRELLDRQDARLPERVRGVFATPLLVRQAGGGWLPAEEIA